MKYSIHRSHYESSHSIRAILTPRCFVENKLDIFFKTNFSKSYHKYNLFHSKGMINLSQGVLAFEIQKENLFFTSTS